VGTDIRRHLGNLLKQGSAYSTDGRNLFRVLHSVLPDHAVTRVRHIERPRAVEGQSVRVGQRAWRYFTQELAARAEPLDAVVGNLRHVKIALRVKGDAGGYLELSRAGPRAVEFLHELSEWTEHLDPVVSSIDDEHIAFAVDSHSGGVEKLTFALSARIGTLRIQLLSC
jgi:hypothetical protein